MPDTLSPPLKLICVGDPHLVPPGDALHGLDPEDRMRRCVADIATHHADAFACIVMGDLAHKADPDAYALFSRIITGLPMPVHLMIGNHDRRVLFTEWFPDTPRDPAGFVQTAFDTPVGRFILTDSVEEGQNGGTYCAARLDWLRGELARAGDRDIFLFMHHPPFDIGLPFLDRIGQADKAALADLLRGDRRIRHLFLAHIHRPLAGSWMGIPFSSARSLNHQVPLLFEDLPAVPKSHEPPSYSIALIDGEKVVVHIHDYLDRSRLPMPQPAS